MRLLRGLLVGISLASVAAGTMQASPIDDATVLAVPAASWVPGSASAAGPTVALGDGVLELQAGQTAELAVTVADVQGLYGFEMQLRIDPAVAAVVDADPARPGIQVTPGDFLSPDFVAQNLVDNQAGTINFALTQLNPSAAKSGSGTLFTVRLRGLVAGDATRGGGDQRNPCFP